MEPEFLFEKHWQFHRPVERKKSKSKARLIREYNIGELIERNRGFTPKEIAEFQLKQILLEYKDHIQIGSIDHFVGIATNFSDLEHMNIEILAAAIVIHSLTRENRQREDLREAQPNEFTEYMKTIRYRAIPKEITDDAKDAINLLKYKVDILRYYTLYRETVIRLE